MHQILAVHIFADTNKDEQVFYSTGAFKKLYSKKTPKILLKQK